MQDIRYIISDASKKIGVEQYTLRYWEEELHLDVQRNEMGHRYYREEDIEVFRAIKTLKNQGYQLRAIKMLLPEIISESKKSQREASKIRLFHDIAEKSDIEPEEIIDKESIGIHHGELVESGPVVDKIEQFKAIMKSLVVEAMEENSDKTVDKISENVTQRVIKEMNYLFRVMDEKEDERFRQFDKALREMQTSRAEAAATKMFGKKRKRY